MAPAALSTGGVLNSPMLWLSALLNVPGILVMHFLLRVLLRGGVPKMSDKVSDAAAIAGLFIIQTVIISYLVFVYLRHRKLKAQGGAAAGRGGAP